MTECAAEVETFYVKQGDLLPVIEATLKDSNAQPVPLAGCTVKFHMRPRSGGTVKINALATKIDDNVTPSTRGIVQYPWTGTDTDTAGNFDCEWEVTTAGGHTITFPNPGPARVVISPQLA